MKILTQQEYDFQLKEGCGVIHFMGGISSKNGNEIVLLGDRILFFERNEVRNKEFNRLLKEQEKEALEYANSFL